MNKFWVLFIVLFVAHCGYGQYIPMPTDSSTWRYRINDIDGPITNVDDLILFFNGTDTAANGHVYHQVFSRSAITSGATYYNPPVVSVVANHSDLYFEAIREDSQKVYQLDRAGETLIYDFSANVGDSIPAFAGTVRVIDIDSVLMTDGIYHKRFLTSNPAYYVIEGVGSSLGLFPDYNDGSGMVVFYCFTRNPLSFLPDTTVPCTYVYPFGYAATGVNANQQQVQKFTIYPVPADNTITINTGTENAIPVDIMSPLGKTVWQGEIKNIENIAIGAWFRGLYFVRYTDTHSGRQYTYEITID